MMKWKLPSALSTPAWREGWAPVEFFFEGQEVWTVWPRGGEHAVRCHVAVAAGDSARIVNEARGINMWVDRWNVRKGPPPSPARETGPREF